MAIALVTNGTAKNTVDGGVGAATTSAFDSTGGNLIIVGAAFYPGGSPNPTCTDSKSNTYTPLNEYSFSFVRVKFFYCESATVGSGHTITVDDPTKVLFLAIGFAVFSGAKTASAFDVQNGASTASSTTLSTGSVTPSEDNELIVSVLGWQAAGIAASIDNGMTISDQIDAVGNKSEGMAFAYKIQASLAAINPQWTLTFSDIMATAIATFKAPATGPNKVGSLLALFQ